MGKSARCGECGTRLASGNVSEHYRRVHPKAKIPLAPEIENSGKAARKAYQGGGSRSPVKIAVLLAVALIVLAVITVGAVWYVGQPSSPSVAPKLLINHDTWDFGEIPPEKVDHSFIITNSGQAMLELYTMSTSCDCTSAKLILPSGSSPLFSMHGNPNWKGTLAPGESATLQVFYDPFAMAGEYGRLERVVYVPSNDPALKELQVHLWITKNF